VWPLAVVMRGVAAQRLFEVAAAEDEQPVEAFGADGADDQPRLRQGRRPAKIIRGRTTRMIVDEEWLTDQS
jgi:hypothetical protein